MSSSTATKLLQFCTSFTILSCTRQNQKSGGAKLISPNQHSYSLTFLPHSKLSSTQVFVKATLPDL